MKSIFKTFFLSLCMIANVAFAYAQTASILPPAKTTFVDQNGKPLVSGTVDFYIPLTTTRKTTWQDAAETVPNTNPVVLDSAGRALILGSGSYRQVVKDRNGNIIWDQVTSSAGTGSGGSVATGDGDLVGTVKPWAGMTAPNQYMFTYGQEISRTLFPALFTAITSSQAVFCNSGSPTLNGLADTTNFWIGMTVELSCVGAGNTTIIGKTATTLTMAANANVTTNTTAIFFPWGRGNGTTTFNLPDFRGQVLAGNNNMGGIASTNLTTAFFGSKTPNATGATGGTQNASISILQGNLPNINFTVTNPTITVTSSGTAAGGIVNFGAAIQSGTQGGSSFNTYAVGQYGTIVAAATGGIVNSGGSGTPLTPAIIQPTITTNYIIKVTPDQNASTASGVTSLGLMTGDIACGTGLLCTGNNVSVPVTVNGVTGSGPIVLQTSPTIITPTVTNGTFNSPTLVTPALGTPASGVATNLTGTAAGLTAGNVTTNANLTGPVTSVGNATSVTNNAITNAMIRQGIARSVIGVTGNATANVADIQGTADQALVVNSAGTALAFGKVNLTSGAGVTGTLPVANGGTGDTGTAWSAFTASVACGTATITTTSSRSKTLGKTAFVELDVTFTALGSCTNLLTFNLPATAQSGGGIAGRELLNSGRGVNCSLLPSGTTASCTKADATNFSGTDHITLSGVYETQ